MSSYNQYPPLELAKLITNRVNDAWEDGSFLASVTPTTRNLLTYWFGNSFCEQRQVNFHAGQCQAIKNIIYLHDVMHCQNVRDIYEHISPDLLVAKRQINLERFSDEIYNHPKYAVKMATGTGKTWVLEALLLWQYLNARHNEPGNYTRNFLLVAPGLIVYERLLDAFKGKLSDDGTTRDINTGDLYKNQELFIPEEYRQEVFGFLNSCVVRKEEIGNKVTGDGLLAITNYHLLMVDKDEESDRPGEISSYSLPVRPGTTAGNSLDVLDGGSSNKQALEYLHDLDNLMVINDEAHHIHGTQKRGERVGEVEWQKSLRYIADGKVPSKYMQVDFSATPYMEQGKGKIYFPHIVIDFNLRTAIQSGLVKTIALDERKELNTEELDFRAIRENGHIIDISDGQRTMLRAGLAKLKLLEDSFAQLGQPNKSPKMMIMCEETEVVGHVHDFLIQEGLSDDDILEIHSNKKGEVGEEEWNNIKLKLSSLDQHDSPKVVISVLMLREGFDVNNICVIVPLRSTQSGILLEQTIGRGLRLMWRGDPEIDQMKADDRRRIFMEHKQPQSFFDILSIVEHPAFRQFYDELIADGTVADFADTSKENEDIINDFKRVGLKDNYQQYDFYFPTIISEGEQTMPDIRANISSLRQYPMALDELEKIAPTNDRWITREATSHTTIGDFVVSNNIFQSTSYNDYLARLVNRIVNSLYQPDNKQRRYPALAINLSQVTSIVDNYIRNYLFGQTINPQNDKLAYNVLLISGVINHIAKQISGLIVGAQEHMETTGNVSVHFTPLSSIDSLLVRENYSVNLAKNIYELTPYPKNKGGFERDFLLFADHDGEVDAVAKVIESKHTFVRLRYVRNDGLPSSYIPDFFVRIGNDIYMVETKAQNQLQQVDVLRKKKAAIHWVNRINALPADKRQNYTWHYAIVGDETFYDWKNRNATMHDILNYFELKHVETTSTGQGRLFL